MKRSPDIVLATGRTVSHRIVSERHFPFSTVQEAFLIEDPNGELTETEWSEYCATSRNGVSGGR